MRQFIIQENQLNYVISILGLMKAKKSYGALKLLENLPLYVEKPVVVDEIAEPSE